MVRTEATTYTAKYRDGSGIVREISTGCRDEDAARSVLGKLERRAELVKSEVLNSAEATTADHQSTPVVDHFAEYLTHQNSSGVDSLPSLDLESPESAELAIVQATGTDGRDVVDDLVQIQELVAPDVALTRGEPSHFLSILLPPERNRRRSVQQH